MTATEFLNANPDIRQFYYSQSWSGRSDWEILVNWVNMTTERTARYYQAKTIVEGGSGGNGGGDIIPGISNTMLILIAAGGLAFYFLVLKKK